VVSHYEVELWLVLFLAPLVESVDWGGYFVESRVTSFKVFEDASAFYFQATPWGPTVQAFHVPMVAQVDNIIG